MRPTFPIFPTFPTFLICFYFSLLFHENGLLSLLFHSKMSFMRKNPEIFSRSLGFNMLTNVFFSEYAAKTSQSLFFTAKSLSVQLVLLPQQESCLLSVKFPISNNSLC